MEMLLHPAVAARVPLSAFRPGNTKLFMSAGTPFVLRRLKHALLYPFVRRLQLWWQRRESDVNQRRIASAKRCVAAAQDQAALGAVAGVASVRTAIEVKQPKHEPYIHACLHPGVIAHSLALLSFVFFSARRVLCFR